MLTATQHQRVDRYLAELAGALGALPESERDDVVAGVREHIEAALTGRSPVTDADVDEVLRALGDPLAIAAEATGDDSGSSGPRGVTTEAGPRRIPLTSRASLPTLVVLLLVAAPLVLMFFAALGGFLLLPFALIAGWALLWLSPLWTVGEKVAGTFLLPGLGVVVPSFTFLVSGETEVCSSTGSGDRTSSESCTTAGDAILTPLGAWLVIGVLAVAAVTTAVVLIRNGQRRAAEPAQSFSTGA